MDGLAPVIHAIVRDNHEAKGSGVQLLRQVSPIRVHVDQHQSRLHRVDGRDKRGHDGPGAK